MCSEAVDKLMPPFERTNFHSDVSFVSYLIVNNLEE